MAHVYQCLLGATVVLLVLGCATTGLDDASSCVDMVSGGLRPIATDRAARFLGKVQEPTAQCRGGDRGTYRDYVSGRGGVDGRALKVWSEMRLPSGHPQYAAVGLDP